METNTKQTANGLKNKRILISEQIAVKSKFYGWKKTNEKEALEYATWKINAITMGKTDRERLSIVNDCLRGIKFSF